MTTRIRLADHVSTLNIGTLTKMCKPLFDSTCVSYFCYLRRYKDNTFTFLPTIVEMGQYFFEDGKYPLTWFAGLKFDDLQSGYFYWDLARQASLEDSQQIYCEVTKRLKLRSGIDIVEKNEDYCDFYSFSSMSSDIYFIPMHDFYQFVYYFKQECRTLLLNSHDDRLQFAPPPFYLPPIPFMNTAAGVSSKKNDVFNIQRYYLDKETFLTRREVGILQEMDKGKAVKCVADHLCISPRTLEHHITNIKNKLNVSRTTEMLYLAKLNHIIL